MSQVLCYCFLRSTHVCDATIHNWGLKILTSFRSGLSHLRIRVIIAYVLLGITYAVVFFTILLSCQPFHHFWQVNPDPGLICQPTKSPAYVLVVVIPNILTDIYLLSIPLPVS